MPGAGPGGEEPTKRKPRAMHIPKPSNLCKRIPTAAGAAALITALAASGAYFLASPTGTSAASNLVGSALKSIDQILFGGQCGQHQDCRPMLHQVQLLADLITVFLGEVSIENHDVEMRDSRKLKAGRSVVHDIYSESPSPKPSCNRLRQTHFVLCH